MKYQNELLEQADVLFEEFKQDFNVTYSECSYYDNDCTVYYLETRICNYKFTVELIDGIIEKRFEILD